MEDRIKVVYDGAIYTGTVLEAGEESSVIAIKELGFIEVENKDIIGKNEGVWITMNDPFLSDWGKAKGKINKCIMRCDSYAEAKEIAIKLKMQGSFKYVHIHINGLPYMDKNRYYISKVSNKGNWWSVNEEDYFEVHID